jgi:hypothetical protein
MLLVMEWGKRLETTYDVAEEVSDELEQGGSDTDLTLIAVNDPQRQTGGRYQLMDDSGGEDEGYEDYDSDGSSGDDDESWADELADSTDSTDTSGEINWTRGLSRKEKIKPRKRVTSEGEANENEGDTAESDTVRRRQRAVQAARAAAAAIKAGGRDVALSFKTRPMSMGTQKLTANRPIHYNVARDQIVEVVQPSRYEHDTYQRQQRKRWQTQCQTRADVPRDGACAANVVAVGAKVRIFAAQPKSRPRRRRRLRLRKRKNDAEEIGSGGVLGWVVNERPAVLTRRYWVIKVRDDPAAQTAQSLAIQMEEAATEARKRLYGDIQALTEKQNAAVLERLGSMDAKLDVMNSKMDAQAEMMKSLIGNELNIPSLFYVVEETEKPKGMAGRVKSMAKPFTDTCKLVLICPYGMHVVKCGPNGDGYPIERPSQLMKEWGPALKLGIALLQVGIAVGRGFGLPLPGIPPALIPKDIDPGSVSFLGGSDGDGGGDDGDEDGDIEIEDGELLDGSLDAVKMVRMLSGVGRRLKEAYESGGDEEQEGDLELIDQVVDSHTGHEGKSGMPTQEELEKVKKVTGAAFRSLEQFLVKRDPALQYLGVEKATSVDTGKTEWVAPGYREEWLEAQRRKTIGEEEEKEEEKQQEEEEKQQEEEEEEEEDDDEELSEEHVELVEEEKETEWQAPKKQRRGRRFLSLFRRSPQKGAAQTEPEGGERSGAPQVL